MMNGLTEGIQNSIQYIEDNLSEKITIEEAAAQAYLSTFHFQRIFSSLCGMTVAEYIRLRRLTRAGEELSTTCRKVTEIALKYGYESPDSFARAFARFHGISPSAAKEHGAELKCFAPLKIKLTLEGGTMTEYRIVEKPTFTIIGRKKSFNSDTSYEEIPKFWQEHYNSEFAQVIEGDFGACIDGNGKEFDYLIADLYKPWNDIPTGCEAREIPAGAWAVFPCRGALPKALQDVNTKIWTEWLPAQREYKLAGTYNLEVYSAPVEKPDDYYCEIWVPVTKSE